MAAAVSLRTSFLFLPALLSTCTTRTTIPPTSDVANLGCNTAFSFDDGTGYGNGILCLNTDYEAYGGQWAGVYHHRCSAGACDWWLYVDVDVQMVCENVLCNLEPSSLCMSTAQFWETGDGWRYAVCRVGSTPTDERMAFWRTFGTGTTFDLMEEQSLVYYCEE